MQNQLFIDKLTRIDELILKEIDIQQDILNTIKGTEPKTNVYVSYPTIGKKDIPTGITRINFDTGDVYLPGDTVPSEITSTSVDEKLRSIFVYIESTIKLIVKNQDKIVYSSGVPATTIQLRNIVFDRIEVQTYKPTLFWCIASTDPSGINIDLPDYYEGKPFIQRGTLTLGTPVEIDIRSSLGRNARSGYIGNMGDTPVTAGSIKVWEDDGTGYTTTYYIIEPHGMVQWEKADIRKIKIEAYDTDGTSYEIHVR